MISEIAEHSSTILLARSMAKVSGYLTRHSMRLFPGAALTIRETIDGAGAVHSGRNDVIVDIR